MTGNMRVGVGDGVGDRVGAGMGQTQSSVTGKWTEIDWGKYRFDWFQLGLERYVFRLSIFRRPFINSTDLRPYF